MKQYIPLYNNFVNESENLQFKMLPLGGYLKLPVVNKVTYQDKEGDYDYKINNKEPIEFFNENKDIINKLCKKEIKNTLDIIKSQKLLSDKNFNKTFNFQNYYEDNIMNVIDYELYTVYIIHSNLNILEDVPFALNCEYDVNKNIIIYTFRTDAYYFYYWSTHTYNNATSDLPKDVIANQTESTYIVKSEVLYLFYEIIIRQIIDEIKTNEGRNLKFMINLFNYLKLNKEFLRQQPKKYKHITRTIFNYPESIAYDHLYEPLKQFINDFIEIEDIDILIEKYRKII